MVKPNRKNASNNVLHVQDVVLLSRKIGSIYTINLILTQRIRTPGILV